MSQSSGTPRKLLLRLRAKAFEDLVINGTIARDSDWTNGFAIWGAGRDGKDFLKALSRDVASKVMCFVDVDQKKIEHIKWYENPALGGRRIPILHFSVLSKAESNGPIETFGRMEKRECCEDDFRVTRDSSIEAQNSAERTDATSQQKPTMVKKKKNAIKSIDPAVLRSLPVVVCVAMYRTNGALESNVASIGRREGEDLWHII